MKNSSTNCVTFVCLLITCFFASINAQKPLAVGVAQQDWIPQQQLMQYKLDTIGPTPIAGTNKEIIFIVTPFSGDADLFVKISGPPSLTDYDLRATATGADYVFINSTSPFASHTGPFYIAVYSSKLDVTYSILTYVTSVHIQLSEGVPQLANVRNREQIYFKYVLTEDNPGVLSFSNVAVLGDPDIFVSMTYEYPNITHNNWARTDQGSDLLQINNAQPGTYYIAIYGFTRSIFALTATHSNTQTELIGGVPFKLTLPANQYAYFRYNLTHTTELTFQLQKDSWTGDPDLFVSKNYDRPNSTHHEWQGQSLGADLVRIPNAATGIYYISVRAWGYLAVTFSLVVKTSESSTFLISGEPQEGSNLAGKYDYYKFDFGGKASQIDNTFLDFTVTPIFGSVQLYGGDSSKQFPTRESNTWVGNQIATSSVIHFEAPIPVGIYYLSVLSLTDTQYQITAAVSTRFVEIQPGQSYTYQIERLRYRKFYFTVVDNTQPVIIALYSYQGDADVYVGLDDTVDKDKYIWSSTRITNDVISIEAEDKHRHVKEFTGRLYIAVYGYADSYFTLNVNTNTTVTIDDGVTVRGLVNHQQYQYYRYFLHNAGSLTFNLRAIKSTDDPDIYVSVDNPHPTQERYQWRSIRYGSDYINIPNALKGWYYIGIHGWNDNSTYLLTVSTDYSVLSGFGYSIFDYVPAGSYRYYGTYLDSANITATVTLIIGSTELYMLRNTTKPSRTEYTAKDDSWPGNFIQLGNQEPGMARWTYAVYGVEDSAYLISTTSGTKDQGALRVGEPRLGVASQGQRAVFRYASWFRPDLSYYVSINLIVEDVVFNVYIDQENKSPNATVSKWKQENINDDVVISLPKETISRFKPLYIAIETTTQKEMRFQLVLSDENEPIYLTQEQSTKFKIENGGKRSYEVYSLKGTTGFTAHIDSCDDSPAPQFYMSTSVLHPNSSEYDAKSNVSIRTVFSQVMTSSGVRTTDKLYYVSTAVVDKEQYASIYATTNKDLRPVLNEEGVLRIGDLISTNTQRIIIPAATTVPNHMPITYEVFKRVLAPDVDPKTINMDTACSIRYRKGNSKVGIVDVPPNTPPTLYYDLDITSMEKYLINVIARDKYGLESVYKQIGFNIDNTHNLKFGKPIIAFVNETLLEQFVLPPTDQRLGDNEELHFALTPLSGDVDLYISTERPPTKDIHTWKGENGGYDVITLNNTSPGYTNGKYFVGVLGSSERQSMFSLLAYNTSTILQLEDGLPQIMTVKREQYNYFEFYLDDNSTFSVTVAPISGDPDIYVSATSRPSRFLYDWSSTLSTLDFVTVGRNHPNYKPSNKYQIAVYGWKHSLYTITATKQYSINILSEGVAHGGKLNQDEFAYYKFTLSSPRSVTFTVTPLTAEGDPDLLISTSATRPDYHNAMWRQEAVGQDTITISKTDPKWTMGTYYVAVKAFRKELTYQILAVSEIATTILTDGDVQDSQITAPNTYRYFRFFHGFSANAIAFTATPSNRSPLRMYVSRTISKPDPTKKDFEGQQEGISTVVNIPKNSATGWWYCSVYGTEVTNFTISAKTNQRAQVLIDGQVNTDNFVANNFYVYFVYDLTSLTPGASLTISTLVHYGDPDLYISANNSRPTRDNWQWRSFNPRSDSISIPYDQLSHAQSIFIGVFGFFSDASFNILAFSSNVTMELRDNSPVPGSVPAYGYSQYKYEMTNAGRLKFNLEVLSPWPANADLYVDTEPNPSKVKNKWKSELFGQDYILITDAPAGIYYIAVHSSNRNAVTYTLVASTEYATIAVGSTAIDFVDQSKYRYYQTVINSEANFVLISITLINGHTQLLLNNNETRPTLESNQKRAISWPGNSILINHDDSLFRPGTWTIGVYADADSDYFISVQSREGRLTDGQPRTGFISKNFPYSYFVYPIGSEVQKLYVNVRVFGQKGVTDFNTSVCVALYGSQKSVSPSPDEHTYEARSDPRLGGQVVLNVDGLEANQPLHLAVKNCHNHIDTDIRFEMTVSGINDAIYLTQEYASIYSFMNSDYVLLSSRHANSMTVEFESCDNVNVNSIDLVADERPYAGKNNATFIGKQIGTFSTAILSTQSVVKGQRYFVRLIKNGPMPSLYSLYTSTTGGHSRPKINSQFEVREVDRYRNNMGVSMAKLVFKFTDVDASKYAFRVVAAIVDKKFDDVSDDELVKQFNFETLCGVQGFSSASVLGVTRQGEDFVEINVETENRYLLNAIITNVVIGTENVYKPRVMRFNDLEPTTRNVSVGGILILVLAILGAIYLIAGSCWNYIRNKHRGIDVIPNLDFWKDLPFLIWDGIIFVAICGKRGSSAYENFEDDIDRKDSVNDDDMHDENPFKLSQVDESKASTIKGYGAI